MDSQMGFLHALRPGRSSLGLDLMEELRSVLADRRALTLINLRQLTEKNFEAKTGGAVHLNEEGRKTVVVAYQKRKQDEFNEEDMWIIVAYDVTTETKEGRRILRRVAQACKNFGQRVQKSVFECSVDQARYETLRRNLLKEIDVKEDSLRFYRLQEPRDEHVEEHGVNKTVFFDEPLIA